ncbi:hypothetical protein CYLTODRAFT_247048 [Cylindrobasidium torrendii FP15055 ss-10]|uniref:Uncharacterized protein n=1 Tax=Cylindrobasidium torrendii FP15055 ss-10 TaxID=1314674 RepID=A0A0D7BH50_9AGAR|nr:hypothetical protein CYLTODRAFT_247048 [Cylindrobasidium torrendii FP15055 ss-10]
MDAEAEAEWIDRHPKTDVEVLRNTILKQDVINIGDGFDSDKSEFESEDEDEDQEEAPVKVSTSVKDTNGSGGSGSGMETNTGGETDLVASVGSGDAGESAEVTGTAAGSSDAVIGDVDEPTAPQALD